MSQHPVLNCFSYHVSVAVVAAVAALQDDFDSNRNRHRRYFSTQNTILQHFMFHPNAYIKYVHQARQSNTMFLDKTSEQSLAQAFLDQNSEQSSAQASTESWATFSLKQSPTDSWTALPPEYLRYVSHGICYEDHSCLQKTCPHTREF